MLLCSPAAPGRPRYTASGWWVGGGFKLLAALHLAAASYVPTMRSAARAALRRGVFASSELLGLGAGLTGLGTLGPVWGSAHFGLLALHWWVLGSCLQDWATRRPRLRRSSGLLRIGGALLLASLAPSSGYLAGVTTGVALLFSVPSWSQ